MRSYNASASAVATSLKLLPGALPPRSAPASLPPPLLLLLPAVVLAEATAGRHRGVSSEESIECTVAVR